VDLVRENIAMSKAHGWSPMDFGALAFDEELVAAVEEFQRDRFLPVTGVADAKTTRALHTYRSDVARWAGNRERLRRTARQGVPANERLAMMSGVTVYARTEAEVRSTLIVPSGGGVRWLIVPATATWRGHAATLARGRGVGVATAMRATHGHAPAPSLTAGSGGDDAVVVVLGDGETTTRREVAAAADLLEAAREAPGTPLRVLIADVAFTSKKTTGEAKRAWRDIGETAAEVLMPICPRGWGGHLAPEFWTGTTLAEWRIQTGRGLGGEVIPFYDTDRGRRPNEVQRFRAFLKARGYAAHGWFGAPLDVGRGPFYGPLPSHIDRVDDALPL